MFKKLLFIFVVLFVNLFFSGQFNLANAQAVPPAGYSGCSGVDLSLCDLNQYDPNQCEPLTSGIDGLTWNGPSCVSQRQGCFIPHPDLSLDEASMERGVCLLPQAVEDYNCGNKPPNGRCGSEYTLCFDSVSNAGVGTLSDCSCFEGTTDSSGNPVTMCMFLDQTDYDSQVNSRNFNDDHCPICPAGYSASSSDGKCWKLQGGNIGNRENVTSFTSCTDEQVCRYTQDGAGCENITGGGCLAKSPNDTCGGNRPTDCEADDEYYCCETVGQCVAASGEQQTCIRSGDLTPDFGETSCRSLYPDAFPQLCRTESWDWLTLEEGNYCCFSQSACQELGEQTGQSAQTRGVLNTRATNSYDICSSNLGENGGALDFCNECFSSGGIWTSIGCISQDPKNLVGKLINIGVGILGGIFLLRVLAASFMLTSSQGDVKKTSEAKQMITEAVIGIIFVLFSVTILQFIGSDVLKIPGFGG